jgi:hypothetical protein
MQRRISAKYSELRKNSKLPVFAAEPLIFAMPYPSRALRDEDRIPFELFLEYNDNKNFTI